MTDTQSIQHIREKVDDIYMLLHGSTKASEPDGLVQKVQENTKWRQSWARLFWILITAFVGLGGSLIILLLRGSGG